MIKPREYYLWIPLSYRAKRKFLVTDIHSKPNSYWIYEPKPIHVIEVIKEEVKNEQQQSSEI